MRAKADPEGYEAARCALVGNSFDAGVVAVLLGPLFVKEKVLDVGPTPEDLVARMGLPPGEAYAPNVDCSLTRPTSAYVLNERNRGKLYDSASSARMGVDKASSPELEAKLLHSFLRSSDYRGSDVRLDPGELPSA